MTSPPQTDRMPARTPWASDPLSWIATDWLALACAAYVAVQAAVLLGLSADAGAVFPLQALAVASAVCGFVVVHLGRRPHRGGLPPETGWASWGFVLAGLLLSAWGYRGQEIRLELWWAPPAAAVLLIALAPYSTVSQVVRYAAAAIATTATATAVLAIDADRGWPIVVTLFIAIVHIVLTAVGSIVFIIVVTRSVANWNERPLQDRPPADEGSVTDARRVDLAMAARLQAPVAFLGALLERGSVTEDDRERARELSSRLRAELVAESEATWLERLLRGRSMDVDDPERLADRLSLAQRTALRAMLDALMSDPESGLIDGGVALRPYEGGAVAFSLRVQTSLPEGRRIRFLAPYLVSLQTTVRDIRLKQGAQLEVEFEAPLSAPQPGVQVQRSPAPPARRRPAG